MISDEFSNVSHVGGAARGVDQLAIDVEDRGAKENKKWREGKRTAVQAVPKYARRKLVIATTEIFTEALPEFFHLLNDSVSTKRTARMRNRRLSL